MCDCRGGCGRVLVAPLGMATPVPATSSVNASTMRRWREARCRRTISRRRRTACGNRRPRVPTVPWNAVCFPASRWCCLPASPPGDGARRPPSRISSHLPWRSTCPSGLHGVTFSLLWDKVSVFRGLRVPARMGLFAGLALCVLAAMGVATLRAHAHAWTRRIVPIVAARRHPHRGLGTLQSRHRHVCEHSARLCGDSPRPWRRTDHGHRRSPSPRRCRHTCQYSTFHWQNLLSGCSGFFPPSFIELTRSSSSFPMRIQSTPYAGGARSTWFLHGEVFRPDEYASLVAKADASP